jgi:hypothetical protein
MDEEELVAVIIENDLIQLGWIHVSLCELGYGIYCFVKYNVMAGVG